MLFRPTLGTSLMAHVRREEKMQGGQPLLLSGKTILLVEDEYYIADDVRRTLNAAGAEVLGPFATLNRAGEAIDAGGFDCAVIDLNLHGESALPIADRLLEEGRSFARRQAMVRAPCRSASMRCRGSKSHSTRQRSSSSWAS